MCEFRVRLVDSSNASKRHRFDSHLFLIFGNLGWFVLTAPNNEFVGHFKGPHGLGTLSDVFLVSSNHFQVQKNFIIRCADLKCAGERALSSNLIPFPDWDMSQVGLHGSTMAVDASECFNICFGVILCILPRLPLLMAPPSPRIMDAQLCLAHSTSLGLALAGSHGPKKCQTDLLSVLRMF